MCKLARDFSLQGASRPGNRMFRPSCGRLWHALGSCMGLMTRHNLSDKQVAVLVTDGFEQSEFARPIEALRSAGARVHVVAPKEGQVRAWNETDWGERFPVDVGVQNARAEDYDALVLPGGVMNPDSLRQNKDAVMFARSFFEQHKPVAAICHGPQLLIDAEVVHGRKLTSYPSLQKDLENAGAEWVDEEVVVDCGFVTSRKPADLDAFCDKLVEEVAEGLHASQHA